jgi:hypothetical protein
LLLVLSVDSDVQWGERVMGVACGREGGREGGRQSLHDPLLVLNVESDVQGGEQVMGGLWEGGRAGDREAGRQAEPA